jgi:glycine/D-amino acid oxidase-like deaminating enzyme
MRATAARLTSLGIPVEVLDLDRLAAEFPAFDLADVGIAGWEANAGYADPAGATLGLLRRAEELGAETRIGEAVVRVEPSVGGGATVTASSGTRTFCSRLLIAAGPWTAPLVQQVGVNLPLTVERHVVGVVRWRRAAEMPFGHADLVAGYYCKPERPDLYCLGWLHPAEGADPDRYVETVTDGEAETLGQALAARVPAMEEAELFGGWAGLYDVSPDWQPVIGEVAEGIFVDAGTSGHGFKLAPALGKHVADLVTGGRTDPGLAQFHPARFGQHKLLPAGYRAARILG